MRILLLAPEQPQIHATPEIRTISGLHTVQVLNGRLTKQELYNEARNNKREIIHIATHSDDRGVLMSNDEWLEPSELADIVGLYDARMVFFNSCFSSRLANYVVAHGAQYAIYYATGLEDHVDPGLSKAWQFPLRFYEELASQRDRVGRPNVDYSEAFWEVERGDGYYGLAISKWALREKNDISGKMKRVQGDILLMKWGLAGLAALEVFLTALTVWRY